MCLEQDSLPSLAYPTPIFCVCLFLYPFSCSLNYHPLSLRLWFGCVCVCGKHLHTHTHARKDTHTHTHTQSYMPAWACKVLVLPPEERSQSDIVHIASLIRRFFTKTFLEENLLYLCRHCTYTKYVCVCVCVFTCVHVRACVHAYMCQRTLQDY